MPFQKATARVLELIHWQGQVTTVLHPPAASLTQVMETTDRAPSAWNDFQGQHEENPYLYGALKIGGVQIGKRAIVRFEWYQGL
ncbi:MAG: hypothetical protein VX664_00080 [Chloroflexota bacterium]|uniref:Uncharacterized protein n=1 Tax=marine metagenome TaxID=408172 RepID=A0A381QM94_9ZZZZ|nr:hypothetical protein [Chloroflexota bacterium]